MRESDFIIISFIALGLIFYYSAKYFKKLNIKAKNDKFQKLKKDEPEFFEENGLEVLGVNRFVTIKAFIDAGLHSISVNADYVVKKDGKTYSVIKRLSGSKERLASTRFLKSLLGQYLVFQPDGVIIWDKETNKLRYIRLEVKKAPIKSFLRNGFLGYLLALILGACLMLIFVSLDGIW